MRRSFSKYQLRDQLSTLTEINVTPLLDLAFVLLIIFMLTTPLMENSLDLVVPDSSTAKNNVSPQKVQTIGVDRNSRLMLNEVSLTVEELERRLAEFYGKDPQMAVVIRADQELPLQKFIHVMDLLGRIGISKVGVMAHPEVTTSSGSN